MKWVAAVLSVLLGPALAPAGGPESSAAGLPRTNTVVILGDSLAAGLGVDFDEAFPALLQKRVNAAGWEDTVVNAGVSGDTSADGLARLDWLLRRKLDVLILELGGNK